MRMPSVEIFQHICFGLDAKNCYAAYCNGLKKTQFLFIILEIAVCDPMQMVNCTISLNETRKPHFQIFAYLII